MSSESRSSARHLTVRKAMRPFIALSKDLATIDQRAGCCRTCGLRYTYRN